MVSPSSLVVATDNFAALDDPLEWPGFGRPLKGYESRWESNFVIEGMRCAACSVAVEDALRAVPGVVEASVSYGSQRSRVVWSAQKVTPAGLLAAVKRAGYQAMPANDAQSRELRLAQTRKALWRWLVAAFCMMQVMMYAYPAYVAAPGDLSSEAERLLRWASWVLTLPVLVFSCGPFFAAALNDLKRGRVGMDVPVALGILITFAVSTAGTFDPMGLFGREVYFDSLTMFVFFLLTARWLELRLRDRTTGALEALMNRLPDTVLRQSGSAFERVAVRRLRAGDLIRVLPGEAFPADGTVRQGRSWANEALLTGESSPVLRDVGDSVVAGSHNLSGVVLVQVDHIGSETRYAQIVGLMESASVSKPQLAQLADRIAKPFLAAVLLAALAACVGWWDQGPARAVMIAVSVLIVTCPCALSLATPAALLASAGALARRGVLVRRLQALETMSKIDTLVFDKTGTLTSDRMTLKATQTRDGVPASQALAMAAALGRQSLHPRSKALVSALNEAGMAALWSAEEVTESAGEGVSGRLQPCGIDGRSVAPVVLRMGSAAFCAAPFGTADASCVHLSDAQGWLATFEFQEELRAHAKELLAALQSEGIEAHLLSGDTNAATCQVMSQLDGLIARRNSRASCSPQDKLAYLRDLQRRGHRAAMVGDGLNDGPAQGAADVSIAFGCAVPVTQARADVVVLGDQLMALAQTFVIARKAMSVVRQNLVWAAVYNAACIPLAVMGLLPAWLAGLGMAASSLVVVVNALRLSGPIAVTPTDSAREQLVARAA